jgi:hypothetical protein
MGGRALALAGARGRARWGAGLGTPPPLRTAKKFIFFKKCSQRAVFFISYEDKTTNLQFLTFRDVYLTNFSLIQIFLTVHVCLPL